MERDLLRQVEDFSFSRLNSSFGCHTTMKIMLFIDLFDFVCLSCVCGESKGPEKNKYRTSYNKMKLYNLNYVFWSL